jgi:hypothetical protein
MAPGNENGRTDVARPSSDKSITMDPAGATTLDGQNVTNHHEGDAREVRAFSGQIKAGVAQLHGDDAHEHSAS